MYIPKLNKDKFDIVDKDKNGYKINLNNEVYRTPLYLNQTSKYILDMINGKNSIQDIEKKMIARYNKTDKTIIEKDLMNTLLLYYNLRMISWIGNDPYSDKMSYREKDVFFYPVHNMEELILNERDYYSPYKDKLSLRNTKVLEYQSMLGQMHFFALEVEKQKICEVGIMINVFDKTFNIVYMHVDEQTTEDMLNKFLDWIIESMIKFYLLVKDEERQDVKMIIYTNEKIGALNECRLNSSKFMLEGILKKEFSYGDIKIYVRS